MVKNIVYVFKQINNVTFTLGIKCMLHNGNLSVNTRENPALKQFVTLLYFVNVSVYLMLNNIIFNVRESANSLSSFQFYLILSAKS